jgi:hypothetical protein
MANEPGWVGDSGARSIYRRPFSLHDWTFVYGLPVTRRQFRRSDFCARPGFDYDRYQRVIFSALEEHILRWRANGLKAVLGASGADYARALHGDRPVILFTHCSANLKKLEFRDGMIGFRSVVDRVAKDFRGLAEISACNPVGFDDLLRQRAPQCAVKIALQNLTARHWLLFYGFFLGQFALAPSSYAAAIHMAVNLNLPQAEGAGPQSSEASRPYS